MKSSIQVELGELDVEVSVTEDNNGVLMEFEAGTELEGAIDLTDEETLNSIQALVGILKHALVRGRIARAGKEPSPQEKLSGVRPRGGIHGSSEPVVGPGEQGVGQEAAQGSSAP